MTVVGVGGTGSTACCSLARRRRLFHTGHEGATLRENLGLAPAAPPETA